MESLWNELNAPEYWGKPEPDLTYQCHDAPDPAGMVDDSIVPLAEAERRYLQNVLRRHSGSRKELAALLNVSERALYRKLAELRVR